ncbi:baseplate J/gp47 family protein [Methylobacterium sp. WCS2018Hpa-22]|uniref:baseplate J/gp47 family protein n=1 Tax=Methylobacterium sp. WCS2018Hpa-22 TaxID=3073633 RepID=UPI00288933E8|nr:baseplate J/gp47 family protein [Methylobacterium sp. WCS2018Hpa-22]
MTVYTAETLDFSRLDPPSLIPIAYEARLKQFLAKFVEFWNAARAQDPTLPVFNTETIDSDPVAILFQAYAYGDMLLRQATNDAANSLRLPFAIKSDLDYLTQTFHRTTRKLLVPANRLTGAAAVYESDEELRSRAQLAPEALNDVGLTPGGYVYKVRTAFADRIKGVFPINRGAGRVELRVLGRDGDGTVEPALLAEIAAAFSWEGGAQSTDVVTVLSAEILRLRPNVTLYVPSGPDRSKVEAKAVAVLNALGASSHRINAGVFREAIASAAHVGPVITVRVNNPTRDYAAAPEVAPYFLPPTVTSEIM